MTRAERIGDMDRTDLAEKWATAVAEVDDLTERLKYAKNREWHAWENLRQSRALTVPEPKSPGRRK